MGWRRGEQAGGGGGDGVMVIISDGGRELARLWAPLAKERCKAVVGIGMKGLRRKNKEKLTSGLGLYRVTFFKIFGGRRP
jgi:hypothetical protein